MSDYCDAMERETSWWCSLEDAQADPEMIIFMASEINELTPPAPFLILMKYFRVETKRAAGGQNNAKLLLIMRMFGLIRSDEMRHMRVTSRIYSQLCKLQLQNSLDMPDGSRWKQTILISWWDRLQEDFIRFNFIHKAPTGTQINFDFTLSREPPNESKKNCFHYLSRVARRRFELQIKHETVQEWIEFIKINVWAPTRVRLRCAKDENISTLARRTKKLVTMNEKPLERSERSSDGTKSDSSWW